jgi:hypothetical protein
VSQGWFLDLAGAFSCQCTAGQPPRGRSTMSRSQTDVARSVHTLSPLRNRNCQALVHLAPKWDWPAKE